MIQDTTKKRVYPGACYKLYPEITAGGFPHNDQQVLFYSRVKALLRPNFSVIDLGAGRGAWRENLPAYVGELATIRGHVREVIGVDVDPAINENPMIDRAIVMDRDLQKFHGIESNSIDMVHARSVLEHIVNPGPLAEEINRVLKPGGWICAWTPNKWGLVGIVASCVPNRLHHAVLTKLQPWRKERDTFPTAYRLNSRSALKKWFPNDFYTHHTYLFSGPPGYAGSSVVLARLMNFYEWLAPYPLKKCLHIFVQKRNG